jgi:PTH1 family peptidyl-tRNA hydrolase
MKTLLIIGLGNPGKEYEETRHNAGFLFADYFFEKYREEFGFSDWKFSKKLNADISIGKIKSPSIPLLQRGKPVSLPFKKGESERDFKIILLKPQTFMNLSGEAVAAAMKYYKMKLDNIIVAHDDIDLLLGKYKISIDSTSAGHNGVQNVIDMLGTKNFTRLRIGVDNCKDKKIPTEKYVLGKFATAEMKIVSKILPEISDKLFNLSLRA